MIRDRGRIKWTAMMLPEHIAQLRDWQAEDESEPEPDLTEDDLPLLQEELEIAYKIQCDAVINTWRNGTKSTYIGKITELDSIRNLISVDGPYGKDNILVSDIIQIRSM